VRSIWIVQANRGDYSDRTEYAVSWYKTESEATARAAEMEAKSHDWQSNCRDSDNPWDFVKAAQDDIGDESWNFYADTDYRVYALPHGAATKEAP